MKNYLLISNIKKKLYKLKIICLMLIAAAIMMEGCGKESKSLKINGKNITDLENKLSFKEYFSGEITEVSLEVVNSIYQIGEYGEAVYSNMSSSSLAEEVTIFKVKDMENAKNQAQKYLDSRKQDFKDYNPGELKKLEEAIIFSSGDYLVIVVSNSQDEINKILYPSK